MNIRIIYFIIGDWAQTQYIFSINLIILIDSIKNNIVYFINNIIQYILINHF